MKTTIQKIIKKATRKFKKTSLLPWSQRGARWLQSGKALKVTCLGH
jgi:hypothetical protein